MGVRAGGLAPRIALSRSLLSRRLLSLTSDSFFLSFSPFLSFSLLLFFLGYPLLSVSVPRANDGFFAIAPRLRALCTRSAGARGYFIRRMLFNAPRSYSRRAFRISLPRARY